MSIKKWMDSTDIVLVLMWIMWPLIGVLLIVGGYNLFTTYTHCQEVNGTMVQGPFGYQCIDINQR